jgi:hypothetical protein
VASGHGRRGGKTSPSITSSFTGSLLDIDWRRPPPFPPFLPPSHPSSPSPSPSSPSSSPRVGRRTVRVWCNWMEGVEQPPPSSLACLWLINTSTVREVSMRCPSLFPSLPPSFLPADSPHPQRIGQVLRRQEGHLSWVYVRKKRGQSSPPSLPPSRPPSRPRLCMGARGQEGVEQRPLDRVEAERGGGGEVGTVEAEGGRGRGGGRGSGRGGIGRGQ